MLKIQKIEIKTSILVDNRVNKVSVNCIKTALQISVLIKNFTDGFPCDRIPRVTTTKLSGNFPAKRSSQETGGNRNSRKSPSPYLWLPASCR